MKILSFLGLTILCAVSVHGAAVVNFGNRVFGSEPFYATVYGVNPLTPTLRLSGQAITNGGTINYTGHPLPFGTTYTASLWGAPLQQGILPQVVVPPDFQLLATTAFRTSSAGAGSFPTVLRVEVPFVTQPNTPALFQVRAWNNLNGALPTWASALAHSGGELGYSEVITVTPSFTADFAPHLVGLTSFNLTIVPEPGILTLGALGGMLPFALWRSRRRP